MEMNMKKLIYILVAAVALTFCASSCSKYLDQAPDGKISLEDVWTDYDKTMAYMNTCYKNLPTKSLQYFFWTRGPVNWCDDSWDGDDLDVNWAGSALLYNGNASASSHPVWDVGGTVENSYWTKYFSSIRSCAMFIKYADPAVIGNTAEYNRWIAEARLLRAYYYAELLSWFGCALPIIDEPYSYTDDFSQVTRASYYDVVKFIMQECDAAIACSELPWRITNSGEKRRMCKALAWAIKSRMILFAASPLYNDGNKYWTEAYNVTKQTMSELEAHGFKLYDKLNIPNTWGAPEAHLPNVDAQIYNEYFNNSQAYSETPADMETIFQLTNGAWDVANVDCIGAICGYKTGTCPSQELVDAYETIDGQPVLDLAKPYNDEFHLQPNYNKANTLYDPQNPYANRDPRFYATIYYNGSKRYCTWGSAAAANSFENAGQDAGWRGSRTVATWARWEKGGTVTEQPEGLMGWALTGRTATRTGYFERKFAHPNSDHASLTLSGADHKDYRFAEILLNFAEAALESGHEDEARQATNRVRARVHMPEIPASVSGNDLRLRIRNERRVEFALEGQRYFDLRRWCKPDGDLSATDHWVTAAYITCHVDANNKVTGYTYDRHLIKERQCYTNKYLKVPIPLSEVNNMLAVTGEDWQNPGW